MTAMSGMMTLRTPTCGAGGSVRSGFAQKLRSLRFAAPNGTALAGVRLRLGIEGGCEVVGEGFDVVEVAGQVHAGFAQLGCELLGGGDVQADGCLLYTSP